MDSFFDDIYATFMFKKIALILLVSTLFIGCAPDIKETAIKETAQSKIFSAIDDFIIESDSGLYIDTGRNALAIDAANPAFRAKMIPAYLTIEEVSSAQSYTAYLTVMSEIDGESQYQLSVNGDVIGAGFAPATEDDFSETRLNMGTLSLKTGDRIEVASNAVTNGKIPENGGTAYSRGRWTQLRLEPIK